MKKKLEQALEHAREYLKMYQNIGPEGMFGATFIKADIQSGEIALKNISKMSKKEVKEITEKLLSIE